MSMHVACRRRHALLSIVTCKVHSWLEYTPVIAIDVISYQLQFHVRTVIFVVVLLIDY